MGIKKIVQFVQVQHAKHQIRADIRREQRALIANSMMYSPFVAAPWNTFGGASFFGMPNDLNYGFMPPIVPDMSMMPYQTRQLVPGASYDPFGGPVAVSLPATGGVASSAADPFLGRTMDFGNQAPAAAPVDPTAAAIAGVEASKGGPPPLTPLGRAVAATNAANAAAATPPANETPAAVTEGAGKTEKV